MADDELSDRLLAVTFAQQVQIDLLLALVDHIGQKSGVTQVEGLPIRDWFEKKKVEELEKMLIQEEDRNPGLAAHLQVIIDESRRRLEGK